LSISSCCRLAHLKYCKLSLGYEPRDAFLQTIAALSSAEAEFISASAMVQEVIFLRKFSYNLGFPQTALTPVFADNETCIAWSEGSVGGSERAKHVDLRMHFVHEARAAGHLHLHKIDSRLNAADILTKAARPPRLRISLLTSAVASWATNSYA
jgi:hypothetical protein